ncbi:ABC transporter substrate-binding protein [Halorientalis sp.]|uniref:ABC transporter substrate-binding protein n=1 Tax=Halorientalis sp. TaxID=1931229 RepID=UPI0026190C27|nr:ABC transporter substrate-binding protein [Halorientalis sp.]
MCRARSRHIRAVRVPHGWTVRFGAPPDGSLPDVVLRYWIERTSNPGNWTVVSESKVPLANAPQTMQPDDIDTTIIQAPFTTVIGNNADFREVAWSGAVLDGHPVTVLFAQQRVVDDTDVAEGLVSAHVDATNFIRDDPEAAARDASAVIGSGVSEDLAVRAMDSTASNVSRTRTRSPVRQRPWHSTSPMSGTRTLSSRTSACFHFSACDASARRVSKQRPTAVTRRARSACSTIAVRFGPAAVRSVPSPFWSSGGPVPR